MTWLESVVADSFQPLPLSLLPLVARFLTFSLYLTEAPPPPRSLLRFFHSIKSPLFSDPLGILYLHHPHAQDYF